MQNIENVRRKMGVRKASVVGATDVFQGESDLRRWCRAGSRGPRGGENTTCDLYFLGSWLRGSLRAQTPKSPDPTSRQDARTQSKENIFSSAVRDRRMGKAKRNLPKKQE